MKLQVVLISAAVLLTSLACDKLADPPDVGYGDDEEGDEGNPPADDDDLAPQPEPELECLPTDQPYIGSITLDSNAAVETLSGYSVVQGNVGVQWPVSDISSLTCLTEVTGGFWIVDNNVASLAPLANLVKVGGELEIGMIEVLTDITLPALAQVGYLSVYNNENLTNLEMPQLDAIMGIAEIEDNIGLPTCDVTTIRDALTYLGEMFYIRDNGPDECFGN